MVSRCLFSFNIVSGTDCSCLISLPALWKPQVFALVWCIHGQPVISRHQSFMLGINDWGGGPLSHYTSACSTMMHGQTTVHSLLSTASGCTAVICSSDCDLHAGECYHGDNLHGHGWMRCLIHSLINYDGQPICLPAYLATYNYLLMVNWLAITHGIWCVLSLVDGMSWLAE